MGTTRTVGGGGGCVRDSLCTVFTRINGRPVSMCACVSFFFFFVALLLLLLLYGPSSACARVQVSQWCAMYTCGRYAVRPKKCTRPNFEQKICLYARFVITRETSGGNRFTNPDRPGPQSILSYSQHDARPRTDSFKFKIEQ